MKIKQHLIALLFILAIINPFSFMAQSSLVRKPATVSMPAENWKPSKVAEDGGNVKNGVEFYSYAEECNSQKVIFLKLVNKNAFAVKFSYQITEKSAVVTGTVPAFFSLEGYCGALDSNLAKLAIIDTVAKSEEEKQKNIAFIRSHITVTPIN